MTEHNEHSFEPIQDSFNGSVPFVEIIHDGDMRQVMDELDNMSEAELAEMLEKSKSKLLGLE